MGSGSFRKVPLLDIHPLVKWPLSHRNLTEHCSKSPMENDGHHQAITETFSPSHLGHEENHRLGTKTVQNSRQKQAGSLCKLQVLTPHQVPTLTQQAQNFRALGYLWMPILWKSICAPDVKARAHPFFQQSLLSEHVQIRTVAALPFRGQRGNGPTPSQYRTGALPLPPPPLPPPPPSHHHCEQHAGQKAVTVS